MPQGRKMRARCGHWAGWNLSWRHGELGKGFKGSYLWILEHSWELVGRCEGWEASEETVVVSLVKVWKILWRTV